MQIVAQTCKPMFAESPVSRSCRPPAPSVAAHPTSPTATPIHPKERGFPALPNASSCCRQHHKPAAEPVEVAASGCAPTTFWVPQRGSASPYL